MKLALGTVVVILAIGGGVAFAATKVLTPKQESEAVLNDAANQLGVSPQKLSDALKQALKNRVDAAVKAGRLTKSEGARIKGRIDADELPFFPLGPRHGFGHHERHFLFHARLEAGADYLGMTEAELRSTLDGGKTLAQVAKDRDKSVDGLIDAMTAGAEKELDEAVKAGRLTEAEKKEMLLGLKARITDLVNGRFPPRFGPGFPHRIFPRGERAPAF